MGADSNSDPIKYEDLLFPGTEEKFAASIGNIASFVITAKEQIVKAASEVQIALQSMGEITSLKGLQDFNKATQDANDLAEAKLKIDKLQYQVDAINLKNASMKQKAELDGIKIKKENLDLDAKIDKAQKSKIVLTAQQIAQQAVDNEKKKESIRLLKDELMGIDRSVLSINNLRAANSALTKERNAVNISTEEGRKKVEELNATINNNNRVINDNADKLLKQKMNVGNYTESITKAFEHTGLFSQSIATLTAIYESVNEIITIFKAKQEAATAATAAATMTEEANTVAIEVNTVAEKRNIVTTEEEIVAKKSDIVTTEEDTVATELNTAANKANAVSKLGIIGLIIIGLALVGEVIKAATISTQHAEDEYEAGKKLAGQGVTNLATRLANSKAIIGLLVKEKELGDERSAQEINIQKIESEAAVAREKANEQYVDGDKNEILTTVEKLKLLQTVVDKHKAAGVIMQKLADDEMINAKALASIFHETIFDREFQRKADAAAKASAAVKEQIASENRRVVRQITTITMKDIEDRLKMLQEAQKDEIELIDTFSQSKYEHIKKQSEKDILLEKQNLQTELQNIQRQADLAGGEQAVFERAKYDKILLSNAKIKEIKEKANNEILLMDIEYSQKSLDAFNHYLDERQKQILEIQKIYNEINTETNEQGLKYDEQAIKGVEDRITKIKEANELFRIENKGKLKLRLDELHKEFDEERTIVADEYEIDKKKAEDKKKESDKAADDELATAKKLHADKLQIDLDAKRKELLAKGISESSPEGMDELQNLKDNARDLDAQSQTAFDAKKLFNAKQLDDALINAQYKYLNAKNDLDKREAKQELDNLQRQKDFNKQRLEQDLKTIDDVLKGVEEGLKKKAELIQAADQRDIDVATRQIDVQAKLASEGRENVLAESMASADQANEKKLQDAKKAAKQEQAIQLAQVFMKILTQGLANNKSFVQAFTEAGAGEALAKAMTMLISGSYAEGVEDFDGEGTGTSDSNIVRISKGESIATAKGTLDNPGLITAINKGMVDEYFANTYLPILNSSNITRTDEIAEPIYQLGEIFTNEIKSLRDEIRNKPVANSSLKRLGEWTEQIQRDNLTSIINHKKNKTRLGI